MDSKIELIKKKKVLELNKENRLEVVEKEVKTVDETEEERTRFFSMITTSTQLGFAVALPIAGGALLGTYLDKLLGMSPRMTLSLIFFGSIMGVTNIYFLFRDSEKEGKRKQKDKSLKV